MKRRFSLVGAATIIALALGVFAAQHAEAAGPAPDASGDRHEIAIDNFSFAPGTLTVPAGTKVAWVNHDDVPHKVVSKDNKFAASPVLDTGERYSFTFSKPGTYDYYCSIHPMMLGKVVVQ